MTERKSTRSLFAGGAGAALSTMGTVCGAGCAGTCGALCAAPLASVFGISSAALGAWMNGALPILTALSAAAFTVGYYSIYRQSGTPACCDGGSETAATEGQGSGFKRRVYWLSLLLSVIVYGYAIIGNFNSAGAAPACSSDTCEQGSMQSCDPAGCSPDKNSCITEGVADNDKEHERTR